MSDESPILYTNIKDAQVYASASIFDVIGQRLTKNMRYLYELVAGSAAYAGESRQIWPHNHGDLSQAPSDGLTVRRSLYNENFFVGGNTYGTYTVSDSWTEVKRWPAAVGPFRNIAQEIRYATPNAGHAIQIKIERLDWKDSDSSTTVTQGLQTQTSISSTTVAWYTIDGQAWNGSAFTGNDTKLMPLAVTDWDDPDEALALGEFVMSISGTNAGTTVLLYNVHQFEVKATDQGTGQILI